MQRKQANMHMCILGATLFFYIPSLKLTQTLEIDAWQITLLQLMVGRFHKFAFGAGQSILVFGAKTVRLENLGMVLFIQKIR